MVSQPATTPAGATPTWPCSRTPPMTGCTTPHDVEITVDQPWLRLRYEGRTATPDPEIEALIEAVAAELGIKRRQVSDEEIVTLVFPICAKLADNRYGVILCRITSGCRVATR